VTAERIAFRLVNKQTGNRLRQQFVARGSILLRHRAEPQPGLALSRPQGGPGAGRTAGPVLAIKPRS